ncbi:MAG: 50S ribosomal protein L31 [Bacillota bacterium]|nr:50S ribosomal protein L31 [Bacillota bacterium]HHU60881.1 50S ribosomal protein L31 [Natronincola sp.]
MKTDIHPNYGKSVVTCSCGETFETGSTKSEIRVEVCSKCHPFYTGQRQSRSSSGGRVERFLSRYNMKEND